jgi:PhzF family phenazine biosynthesis protein
MKLPIYQVDAFTDRLFGGNPAAVVPLKSWLSVELLQNIAAENNLSETAFYVPNDEYFELRWFTPKAEVDLCGHATLATAHVLFEFENYDKKTILFKTKSGILRVEKENDLYNMDVPADEIRLLPTPDGMTEAICAEPLESYRGKDTWLFVFDTENTIKNIQPDFRKLSRFEDIIGVIVTAPGNKTDFVSRCFFPRLGIDEDPATGAAHTTLTPYWAKRLKKNEMTALQISPRKGLFRCKYLHDRVVLSGQARTYLKGKIRL